MANKEVEGKVEKKERKKPFKKLEIGKDITYPLEITDRSGIKHIFTSGSSATAIFTSISDKFDKNPYASIREKKLIDDFVTPKDLEIYVNLGYLKRTIVSPKFDEYSLTDLGRKAWEWNREFKKKWKPRNKVEYL